MADLVVPTKFDRKAVVEWIPAWIAVRDQFDLALSLPKNLDVSPAGIVVLCACVAARTERGLDTRITVISGGNWPTLTRSLERLRPMNMRLPEESDTGSSPTFIRAITDLREARAKAEVIEEVLLADLPSVSPSAVRMARFVIEELGANIAQHSARSETGFAFAGINVRDNRFELSLADAGVGFLASLQRNPELRGRIADDAEALQLAMSPRITGTSAPRMNMGVGLKLLADFSDLLDGELWIASGSAMLQRKTTAGQRTNSIRSIAPWQGAWICLDATIA